MSGFDSPNVQAKRSFDSGIAHHYAPDGTVVYYKSGRSRAYHTDPDCRGNSDSLRRTALAGDVLVENMHLCSYCWKAKQPARDRPKPQRRRKVTRVLPKPEPVRGQYKHRRHTTGKAIGRSFEHMADNPCMKISTGDDDWSPI